MRKLFIYISCISLILVGCSNKGYSSTLSDDFNDLEYSSFSKGIWISELQTGENDLLLYVNNVDVDQLEGEVFNGHFPVASYFYYHSDEKKYLWNFNASQELLTSLNFYGRTFGFRPYTLHDVIDIVEKGEGSVRILENYIIRDNIEKWGEVRLVPIMEQGVNKQLHLFLENDKNEVLYEFYAPFQNGLDVTELSIEDINRDGLKDVTVILGDESEAVGGVVAWLFLQTQDNLFCINDDVQSKLNTQHYDKIRLDVERIKREFYEIK